LKASARRLLASLPVPDIPLAERLESALCRLPSVVTCLSRVLIVGDAAMLVLTDRDSLHDG
jgi:hypothetical protein